jgi:hypothetical protein
MIDQTVADNAWFISVFHGVGRDFMRIPTEDFLEYLTYLDEHTDQIWVAPMTEVLRYATERSNAKVVLQNGGIRVVLPDTLNPSLYNYPLTVETRVPEGWSFVELTQAGRRRIVSVVRDASGGYIRYELIPETEPIVIQQIGVVIGEDRKFQNVGTFTFNDMEELARWETVEGSWEIGDGVLSSGEGQWTCKLLMDEILEDFMATGRFKILSGGETQSSFSYSGFYIRATECLPGENNGIYYELDNHSSVSDYRSGRVLLWSQWTPRNEEEIPWYWPDRAVATFPASINVDEWHSFRLIAKGDEVLYFLDGKPVLYYDDVRTPRGRFGLMNRGSRVLFDDIELATPR